MKRFIIMAFLLCMSFISCNTISDDTLKPLDGTTTVQNGSQNYTDTIEQTEETLSADQELICFKYEIAWYGAHDFGVFKPEAKRIGDDDGLADFYTDDSAIKTRTQILFGQTYKLNYESTRKGTFKLDHVYKSSDKKMICWYNAENGRLTYLQYETALPDNTTKVERIAFAAQLLKEQGVDDLSAYTANYYDNSDSGENSYSVEYTQENSGFQFLNSQIKISVGSFGVRIFLDPHYGEHPKIAADRKEIDSAVRLYLDEMIVLPNYVYDIEAYPPQVLEYNGKLCYTYSIRGYRTSTTCHDDFCLLVVPNN